MGTGINYLGFGRDGEQHLAHVRFGAFYNNEANIVTVDQAAGFGASSRPGVDVGAGAAQGYPENLTKSVPGAIYILPAEDQTKLQGLVPRAFESTLCPNHPDATVTDSPTVAPIDNIVPIEPVRPNPNRVPPSGNGDPHFKTWTGEKYDYHGECDLVLVDNPTFWNGLGLKVHIRTERYKYWSFISNIAVKIGDNVLEFNNDVNNFKINGERVEEKKKYVYTYLSGFHVRRDPKAISIRFDSGIKAKIDLIQRKNGFPAVVVDGASTEIFKGSLGMLGDWETGKRLARDGVTEMNDEDATAFALEWQVRDTEPLLFSEARYPQYPTICTPPSKSSTNRLGMSSFQKEAEEACAHWTHDKEDCIFDVIATRDITVAAEGNIVGTSVA
jgi:hypothetical protein